MPNHCDNATFIKGDGTPESELQINDFESRLRRGDLKMCETFVPMPEEVRHTTVGSGGFDSYDARGWYGWALENWGTKWGDYDGSLADHEDGLLYGYQTAWGPAGAALRTISEMFPNLTFGTSWSEEGGQMGYFIFRNGQAMGEATGTHPYEPYDKEKAEADPDYEDALYDRNNERLMDTLEKQADLVWSLMS
jgi:hypothetical protein